MIGKLVRAAVFAAAVTAVVGTTVGANAQDGKKYSISDIMKKGHGAKGLLKSIGAEVKEEQWDAAKKDAAMLKEFGEALGSLEPPKGEADSWKKLTGKYKANTAAVADAVGKKDAKAATEALGKIQGSCKECHTPHKG
jgi:cytochrome c556